MLAANDLSLSGSARYGSEEDSLKTSALRNERSSSVMMRSCGVLGSKRTRAPGGIESTRPFAVCCSAC